MRRIAAGAVALVCALVLSGCGLQFSLGFGTEKDGRFDGTEITVPVLYASGTKGVLATQRITAASAEGAGLSIDITENDVSGVDPVTQSATWTAVTAATLLTGARPDTAYTFGFDTRIATPAAGPSPPSVSSRCTTAPRSSRGWRCPERSRRSGRSGRCPGSPNRSRPRSRPEASTRSSCPRGNASSATLRAAPSTSTSSPRRGA